MRQLLKNTTAMTCLSCHSPLSCTPLHKDTRVLDDVAVWVFDGRPAALAASFARFRLPGRFRCTSEWKWQKAHEEPFLQV
mmetsp:Transcript_521/g.1031  ORF Transcript_521/g.1031 Transcript_521/m.1031 type:complete len:80 (+) Transcript_521:93-332(+)